MFVALAGGSLMLLGCIIPDKSATTPNVAPGSAASIGGGAAAPAAAAAPGVAVGKDCGPNGLIDDGEDGNNQNLPNDNRGGYWYTFKDKGTTTVEPTAGEEGGTFAMSEGGHDSQYAARYHGKIGTGAIVFSGHGDELHRPEGAVRRLEVRRDLVLGQEGRRLDREGAAQDAGRRTPIRTAASARSASTTSAPNVVLTTDWKLYSFPFKTMKQMPGWGAPHKPHITPAKLYGIQFQVNVPRANYDIYIDDLKFICE